MESNMDTVCITLKSPEDWAHNADMPDIQAHFEGVVASLRQQAKSATPVVQPTVNTRRLDMARCASEVGL